LWIAVPQVAETRAPSARRELDLQRRAGAGNADAVDASQEDQVSNAKREIIEGVESSKEALKSFFVTQKDENQRLQAQVRQLKQENCGLQQSMIALQRRIADLEHEMGT